MKSQYSVGVIGGGAWGTALAIAANRAGSKVLLATRNRNVMEAVAATRVNEIYLPTIYIDPAIGITGDLSLACRCDFLVLAMPSQCVRSACIAISDFIAPTVPLV
ncbi:MAG: NAD(P)-binding domain-containing protein, partial [Alphaproteobacteria bacterium]|nr:NAD(P)-binding domain-containing protein [Alphaproteobacteria bacterium]